MKNPIGYFIEHNLFVLTQDYTVKLDELEFDIPSGFITDGASIKCKRFVNFITGWSPFDSDALAGATIHDYIYRHHITPRIVADSIFFSLMKEEGAPFLKRWIFYFMVRWFGWAFWSRHYKNNPFK